MDNITLELDVDTETLMREVVDVDSEQWNTSVGVVTIKVINPMGPNGHPVAALTGTPPRVLTWLLNEYVQTLDEALDLMRSVSNAYDGCGAYAGARRDS